MAIRRFSWQYPVKDKDTLTPPVSPVTGDRYLILGTGVGGWTGKNNNIATWVGDKWEYTVPAEGMHVWIDDENAVYIYNGAIWKSTLPAYGEIYVNGNAVATAIGGAGTFVQFVGFANNGSSQDTTPDHGNDHIEIDKPGDYLILGNFCIESVGGGAADTVSIEIRKNNGTAVFNNLHAHRKLAGGGGDVANTGISGIVVSLAKGDTIEVWLTNDDNATDILITHANLTIKELR